MFSSHYTLQHDMQVTGEHALWRRHNLTCPEYLFASILSQLVLESLQKLKSVYNKEFTASAVYNKCYLWSIVSKQNIFTVHVFIDFLFLFHRAKDLIFTVAFSNNVKHCLEIENNVDWWFLSFFFISLQLKAMIGLLRSIHYYVKYYYFHLVLLCGCFLFFF